MHWFKEIKWTEWQPLGMLEGFKFIGLPSKPGCYVLATGHSINRAVGTDDEGILDVGESDDLRDRIQKFVNCATVHGNEGHMAGWRYAFFRMSRHFPYEQLRIRWIETDSKEEAREVEGRMLLAYIAKHSELPPLNYSFNWKPFEADGWHIFDEIIGYTR